MRGFESLRMQRRLADWRADSRLRDLTWRSRSETESVCELLPATRLRLALSTLLFAESLAAMCRDDLESSEVDGWVRAVAMVGTECSAVHSLWAIVDPVTKSVPDDLVLLCVRLAAAGALCVWVARAANESAMTRWVLAASCTGHGCSVRERGRRDGHSDCRGGVGCGVGWFVAAAVGCDRCWHRCPECVVDRDSLCCTDAGQGRCRPQ